MPDIERLISKRIGQPIYKYKMIEENDKILIAVSGGKDSMTLLYDLMKRRKSFPIHYDIEAVHIKTDFCSCCQKSNLEIKFKEWNAVYTIKHVPVLKRLRPGKKMNCYWCSTQRRMELLNFAKERGCNKIALGHHMDDIIETLLMNICYKSEIATMLPKLTYKKFPYTVIRPLALVYEKQIIKFAKKKGINRLICKCPHGQNSKSLEIRQVIDSLSKKDKTIRLNIFNSMNNVNIKYLVPEVRK